MEIHERLRGVLGGGEMGVTWFLFYGVDMCH